MGSGKKFRITWMESDIIRLGISGGRKCEREWSFFIDLIKISIYIGIGKGYEQFDQN